MKQLTLLTFALLLTSCIQVQEGSPIISKTIYGSDDRKEVDQASSDHQIKASKATAAMIDAKKLKESGSEITIEAPTAKERMNLCAPANFAKQISAASCTAFLVAPDIIMTAGHCLMMDDVCTNFRWVFNFETSTETNSLIKIKRHDIYSCKKILALNYNTATKEDYGLVQLKRVVSGIEPLKLRLTFPKLRKSSELFIVGHPMGQPKKIADGGTILSNKDKLFFKSDIDALSGNSGSPVLNSENGLVEGIYVRGGSIELLPIKRFDGTAEGSTCNVYKSDSTYGDEDLEFTSEVMRINRISSLKKLLETKTDE